MAFHKFIKIKGPDGERTGYFVPRLYHFGGLRLGLKVFGLSYIKDRLAGWTYWWVNNEDDFNQAIKTLNDLMRTRIFYYRVSRF